MKFNDEPKYSREDRQFLQTSGDKCDKEENLAGIMKFSSLEILSLLIGILFVGYLHVTNAWEHILQMDYVLLSKTLLSIISTWFNSTWSNHPEVIIASALFGPLLSIFIDNDTEATDRFIYSGIKKLNSAASKATDYINNLCYFLLNIFGRFLSAILAVRKLWRSFPRPVKYILVLFIISISTSKAATVVLLGLVHSATRHSVSLSMQIIGLRGIFLIVALISLYTLLKILQWNRHKKELRRATVNSIYSWILAKLSQEPEKTMAVASIFKEIERELCPSSTVDSKSILSPIAAAVGAVSYIISPVMGSPQPNRVHLSKTPDRALLPSISMHNYSLNDVWRDVEMLVSRKGELQTVTIQNIGKCWRLKPKREELLQSWFRGWS